MSFRRNFRHSLHSRQNRSVSLYLPQQNAWTSRMIFNTLRPRQNGRHFADDIFKYIFLNENAWIPIKISLTFVPKGRINNILALVQIMAWRRPGDKPLSEPMMVSLPTHICVTRPQWVKQYVYILFYFLTFMRHNTWPAVADSHRGYANDVYPMYGIIWLYRDCRK